MAQRSTITRRAAIAVAVMELIGSTPARAEDGPYPPIAAEDGTCREENYVYSDRNDICVSQIGECAGQLWICRGHEHPQFRCDYTLKRPQRCCRKNWPPRPGGRSRGRCWRWKPERYHGEESK